ncbi:hypothetical protein CAOG_01958 [Capsaspora owczarzaki ATCC 30864]|uniref:hypothetical protein n=1 Tax=Capsaspora owczarzaki (strain ATCC 30864) TaxID=595528 RepID=UPI00035237D4|nr:hypothetical protein CAOG_01958 [Capsaspora owczarzaki ATCC 30864]|eukprot:XP_004364826.2 hypothetical protein CAOG_01958 [Capsaspora owczarzaki ATCC 30864]
MSGKAASAWNSNGTWEERDVSAWATARLKAVLAALKHEDERVKIRVASVTTVEGEANIVFPRGKKRAGYEFAAKVKVEVTPAGASSAATGTLEFPYICDDVSNHAYEIKLVFADKAAQALLDDYRSVFLDAVRTQFYDELMLQ